MLLFKRFQLLMSSNSSRNSEGGLPVISTNAVFLAKWTF